MAYQITKPEAAQLLRLMDKEKNPSIADMNLKEKLRHIAFATDEIPYCDCASPLRVAFSFVKPYCRRCYGIMR